MSFITVDGTVDKAFNGGLGFAVVERWQVAGEERKRRWGVWFKDAPGLVEGQHVKVTGVFSSKIREYEVNGEVRRTVDQNVNNARILDGNGQQQPQLPVSAPNTAPQPQWDTQAANGAETGAQGSWATAGQISQASFGGGDDETPF